MPDTPTLFILDVGHGNASLIQENDTTVLIDTSTKAKLRQHLDKLGINKLDTVVLSHADFDHIGGLTGLLTDNSFSIGRVILNADSIKDSEAWDDLVFALDGADTRGETTVTLGLKKGPLQIDGFGEVSIEVASPSFYLAARGAGSTYLKEKQITSNSISAVIRILFGGEPVALLTGDMDDVSLEEIERTRVDISAPLLVFPHHGGLPGRGDSSSFTHKLLDLVNPNSVLFSHGRNNHQNPDETILSIVANRENTAIACTQLSKHCAAELPNLTREFDETVHSSGHASGSCCSGTLRISLPDKKIEDSTFTLHREFVMQHVPKRKCKI